MNKLSELIETVTQAKAEVTRLLTEGETNVYQQIELSVVQTLLDAVSRNHHENHVMLAHLYPDPQPYEVHILWGDEADQEDQGEADEYTFDTHLQYQAFLDGVEAAAPDRHDIVYDSTDEPEDVKHCATCGRVFSRDDECYYCSWGEGEED